MQPALKAVQSRIHFVRGERVMLSADLAEIYGVETRALNQAVKRNAARFPGDFMFQLTAKEMDDLKSQTVTSSWWRGTAGLAFALGWASRCLRPPGGLRLTFTHIR